MKKKLLQECDNCQHDADPNEFLSNENGLCNACNRWSGCKHSETNPCYYYYNDPTHYLCRECRNGSNFESEFSVNEKLRIIEIKNLKARLASLELMGKNKRLL